ncbi:MAG: hypothetical protein PHC98_11325, partial [Syntrophotalea acetylenica]|nr:hypothetical protein [Syntrophotalea acetylenica]
MITTGWAMVAGPCPGSRDRWSRRVGCLQAIHLIACDDSVFCRHDSKSYFMFQKKYEKKSDIIEKISVDIKVFSRNLTFFRKSIMLTKIYTYERRRKIYSKIQKQIASKFGNDETFAKHWEDW